MRALLSYLKQKFDEWEKWQSKHEGEKHEARKKALAALMKSKKSKQPAEVMTWGFAVEKKKKLSASKVSVELSSWANENASNVAVSGKNGELHIIHQQFPDVEITAEFTDEYGRGTCPADTCFEKNYNHYQEQVKGDWPEGVLTREMPAKIVKGETPSVRFTSVAEDAFPVLAKMKGDLELEFVTVLSDEAAKALSQHKGFLSLMGLDESSLSANAVKSLLKHDGPVVFEPPNFE